MPRKNVRSNVPNRVRNTQNIKFSNAAGPHKGRRKDEEIPELEDPLDDVEIDIFDWLKEKDLEEDA